MLSFLHILFEIKCIIFNLPLITVQMSMKTT